MMQIKSGVELLAVTVCGLALFSLYALVVAVGLDLIVAYFVQGCTAENSGALRLAGSNQPLCFEFWLNRYQTLIGGLLALAGAYLAFSAVRQQIAQTERHAAERQVRESNAARSIVTHALSKINSYAGDFVQALRQMRPAAGSPFVDGAIAAPPFPEDAITALQDAVRHSSPEYAAQFADLIAQAQIQKARSSYIVEKSSCHPHGGLTFTDLQNAIFDATDLYVRSGRLFDYGRSFLNYHLVEASQLREAFRVLDLDQDEWPMIKLRTDARERAQDSSSKG